LKLLRNWSATLGVLVLRSGAGLMGLGVGAAGMIYLCRASAI
jgi:hypothetical protein